MSGPDAGADTPAAAPEVDPAPPVVVDGEPLVGCGGTEGWLPSVMPSGIDSDFADEARETFEALLADPELSGEFELTFVRRPLTLDRPLGDRAVLDGSVWPPRAVPVSR